VQAREEASTVSLRSRNGYDIGHLAPDILHELVLLPAPTAILDGELVAAGGDGRPCLP
jgi:ATP-dependent DNA ligase